MSIHRLPLRHSGGLPAKVLLAGVLLLSTLGLVAAAPAAASGCNVTWGSLPKSADRMSDGHVTGVRVGRHRCFDRLVVDLDGSTAGYRVEYVDHVTAGGSGHVVPLRGGAFLQIMVDAPAYDDNGAATADPARINATGVSGFATFKDIEWAGSFEGRTTLGLGVRARLPFQAFVLDGPGNGSRLVIDVAHRWTPSDRGSTDRLPGQPFDGHVGAGNRLAVMGVAHDDVLNVRKAPGINHRIVTTLAPTDRDAVATGRARLLTRSIWYEVKVNGTVGWVNFRYVAHLGDTEDLTASYLGRRPAPAAATMTELGLLVADDFAPVEAHGTHIVVSVAPTVGDLAEITVDVAGLADDSVGGVRLHIFATPHDSGDGFELRTIEGTWFCSRGSDGSICV